MSRTQIRMAHDPATIDHFLKDLSDKLTPLLEQEMQARLSIRGHGWHAFASHFILLVYPQLPSQAAQHMRSMSSSFTKHTALCGLTSRCWTVSCAYYLAGLL